MSTAAPNRMAWCNKLDSLLQYVIGFLLLAMVGLAEYEKLKSLANSAR